MSRMIQLRNLRAVLFVALHCVLGLSAQDRPWQRRAIESGKGGADGVRLDDWNGDGRLAVISSTSESFGTRIPFPDR